MDYKDLKSKKTSDFWFKAKNQLIEILMQKIAKSNLKILNIGSGTGDDLDILNKFGENYIIDINQNALDLIPKDKCKEKKQADACNLPYKNNYFDTIVAFDVFEHIPDHNKAIEETYRVLKKDGTLIFTVPAFQFLFSSHDKALEHQRRYNKKQLKKLLKNFNNLKLNYWNVTLFYPLSILRILKKKSKPKTDHINLPKTINNLFYKILKTENKLIKKNIPLPPGLTIIGTCKKKLLLTNSINKQQNKQYKHQNY